MNHAPFDKTIGGATIIYVTEEDRAAADRIVAMADHPVRVEVTPNAFSGRAYGFKDKKAFLPCLVIEIVK